MEKNFLMYLLSAAAGFGFIIKAFALLNNPIELHSRPGRIFFYLFTGVVFLGIAAYAFFKNTFPQLFSFGPCGP